MFFRNEHETDIELIGVLAADQDINPSGLSDKKQAVFINRNNDIQYQVKAISENAPKRLFTGYISSVINSEGLDTYQDNDTRIENFKSAVSQSLFLFTYYKSQSTSGEEYYKISQAILINRPSQINANTITIAAPVYSPKDITNSWESTHHLQLNRYFSDYREFLSFIESKKSIGKVAHFEGRDEFPRFIIWDDGNKFCAIGPFTSARNTSAGYFMQYDELYEVDLSDMYDYLIYEATINSTILHMNEKTYELVYNSLLKQEGVPILKTETTENTIMISDSTATKPTVEVMIKENYKTEAEEINDEVATESEDVIEPVELDSSNKNDEFLLQLCRYCSEDRLLFYYSKDLSNFHTAMKTGSLVILSGMSGTGKSALVDVYARALGIPNDRLLTIPVRPSWNDDSDLLGYVDLVHRVYHPSDTGFIKFIVEASEHKNDLYIVCLDEMNLARVEHYFSQFLSILEKPVGQRVLRLYDPQYTGSLYNYKDYPDTVEIHDNIKFVGTVNIDESTYHFADKVLDRANIINLKVLDYTKDWKSTPYSFVTKVTWTKEDYSKLVKAESLPLPKVRDFLWKFHQLLNSTNSNFGIGPRVVISIEKYLNNRPDCENEFSLSMNDALDYQIKQRVLTKLRGPEEQFGSLLEEESNDQSIAKLFAGYLDLSLFKMCKQVLEQKKREINIYGYCL